MQSDTFKISNPTITYTNISDLCEIPKNSNTFHKCVKEINIATDKPEDKSQESQTKSECNLETHNWYGNGIQF